MLRTTNDLIDAGLAPTAKRAQLDAVAALYAVAVPPTLARLIDDPDGPIGRQFIPHADELATAAFELVDPIGDDANEVLPGLVHRYPDRVLLKPLLICPTYCRFCFRRAHVGPDGGVLSEARLRDAMAYIAAHEELREVILTGGDPLMLSARRLGEIMAVLSGMVHLDVLRIHTRVPVAMPERLDAAMLAAMATDKALFVVVHVNHAAELDAAATALGRVLAAGIPVLSQTVLLRGVNDTVEALDDLFRGLLRLRVKPYYLHQLDPAPGTARFHVPVAEGRALLRALRGRISGMALPRHVFDTPRGKVTIDA